MLKKGKPPFGFWSIVIISALAAISEPLGFLALIIVLIAWTWNQPVR